MEFLIAVIAIAMVAGFTLLFIVFKKQTAAKPQDQQALLLLQGQINELARVLDTKLGESTRAIQQQFGHSAQIVRDVTEKLVSLDETN